MEICRRIEETILKVRFFSRNGVLKERGRKNDKYIEL